MALAVFIAEDNQLALDSLVELLTAVGDIEIVGTAKSELDVADWLISHPSSCDVLVTDLLLLPGGSGFGVVRHVKTLRAATKVVVFSDFVTPAVARRCAALGADAVFNKSDLDRFLDYIRSLRTDVVGALE